MQKKFTLIETVIVAGVFSSVFFSYGFFIGRESARKQLGSLIDDLRRGNPTSTNEKVPNFGYSPWACLKEKRLDMTSSEYIVLEPSKKMESVIKVLERGNDLGWQFTCDLLHYQESIVWMFSCR